MNSWQEILAASVLVLLVLILWIRSAAAKSRDLNAHLCTTVSQFFDSFGESLLERIERIVRAELQGELATGGIEVGGNDGIRAALTAELYRKNAEQSKSHTHRALAELKLQLSYATKPHRCDDDKGGIQGRNRIMEDG